MEKSNFEDITVSEICAFSNVSRGTFYNNFESKEEILSTMIHKEITEKLDHFMSINDDWMEDAVYLFFETSKKRSDFLSLLVKQNLFRLFRQELVKVFSEHDLVVNQSLYQTLPPPVKPYIVSVYIASALAIYRKWSENGFVETTKEITEVFLDIVHHPEIPYPKHSWHFHQKKGKVIVKNLQKNFANFRQQSQNQCKIEQ